MPIGVLHEIQGGTQEQYDKVASALTDGGALGSPGDWPVEGLLSHASGPTENGWRVMDVWESEDAFQRFGEVLRPILEEAGMSGEPQVFELYNFVK